MFEFLVDADQCRLVLTVLRDFLELAARSDEFSAAPFDSDSAPLRHLRQYLAILGGIGDDPALCEPVGRMLTDLMALAVGARRDVVRTATGVRAARLRAIKTDITNNIESDDLSVTRIAARHGITPRHVQALFAAEGTTFTQFVLGRPLSYAYRMLADPRLADRPITTIAFDAGFGDVSYFNRSFRRRFGVTPSRLRAEARRNDGRQAECCPRPAGAQAEPGLQCVGREWRDDRE